MSPAVSIQEVYAVLLAARRGLAQLSIDQRPDEMAAAWTALGKIAAHFEALDKAAKDAPDDLPA